MAKEKNEIAEVSKEVSVKELIKQSEGSLIKLQSYEETEETLKGLVTKFSHIEKVNEDNFEESKKARAEIREHRYVIQNVTKHNADILNNLKKDDKSQADKLIEIISHIEDRIDAGIKYIENEKKRIKEEKERKEQERITSISKMIAEYKSFFDVKIQIGKTQEDLDAYNSKIEELKNSLDSFDEFKFEGDDLLEEFETKKEVIQKRIDEEKFIQEENVRLAKEKEEQDKKAEELRLEQEKFQKEKEEFEANKKAQEEKIAKEEEERQAKIKKEDEERLAKQKVQEEEELKRKQEELISFRKKLLIESGFTDLINGSYVHKSKISKDEYSLEINVDESNEEFDRKISLLLEKVGKEDALFIAEQEELKQKEQKFIEAQSKSTMFIQEFNYEAEALIEKYQQSIDDDIIKEEFALIKSNIQEAIKTFKQFFKIKD